MAYAEEEALNQSKEEGQFDSGQEPAKTRGRWLDLPDEPKVAKEVWAATEKQERLRKRTKAYATRNTFWVRGVRGVRILEDYDRSDADISVYVPRGASALAAPANSTDRLVRRMVSAVLANPPVLEAEPASASDEDRDAAELSTRLLAAEGSDSGFNLHAMAEEALQRGGIWGSDYIYFCVDPHGGGWQPTQIKASPKAQAMDPDPRIDPETGQVDTNLVLRYAMEDGTVSDSPVGAIKRWVPKIKREHLTPMHLTILPEWSKSLPEADGVILVIPTTLGELRDKFPEAMGKLSDQDILEAVSAKPKYWKDLLPASFVLKDDKVEQADGKPSDSTLLFPAYVYYRSCSSYPEGAYVVALTPKHLLYRESQVKEVPADTTGKMTVEVLDIPVVQCRQLVDYATGNPHGEGLAAKVGPMDEVSQSIMTFILDYCFRAGNPNVFVPVQSPIQPGALGRRDGTPLPYFPGAGNPVIYEDVGELPRGLFDTYELIERTKREETGLNETVQGLEASNVQSGVQARLTMQAAIQALNSIHRGVGEACVSAGRIVLQLARANYSGPQLMKYVGEDGEYKLNRWRNTELGSTRDIKIALGSFDMSTPAMKQQFASEMLQLAAQVQQPIMTTSEWRRIVTQNIHPRLNMQDDPHVMRVKREIGEWEQGPQPAQIQAAQQQMMLIQQQMATVPIDPTQPPPQMPTVMQLVGQLVFPPLPINQDPNIAATRYDELARYISGAKFRRFDKEWQGVIVAQTEQARIAAGIQTVQEQQLAAQAQHQAQQDAEQKDREGAANEADANRKASAESEERKGRQSLELQKEKGRQQAVQSVISAAKK